MTIYLAMILDLEIIGILIKENFIIWTYFMGTRSKVSFGEVFFFFLRLYFWPVLCPLYFMFWMQNFCSISDFPWPIHSFVLVSPFSTRLWLLYWRYIFSFQLLFSQQYPFSLLAVSSFSSLKVISVIVLYASQRNKKGLVSEFLFLFEARRMQSVLKITLA